MAIRFLTLVVWSLGTWAAIEGAANAHEMRPGYLEIRERDEETFDVLWKVPAMGDRRLALYPRFASDVQVVDRAGGIRAGAYVERFHIHREGGLGGTPIRIDGLSATFTDVLLRFERNDGTSVTQRLTPERPSTVIQANDQTVLAFFALGIEHILTGFDHLLFVVGLLFIVRGGWMLTKTITAFTVAHSLTLGTATLGYAYPPVDLLNVLIALSILFLAPEMLRSRNGQSSFSTKHPWVMAFGFGLLHGFGFASGLTEIGLPRAEIPWALLMFNLGVEVGQLGFVAVLGSLAWSWRVLEVHWPEPASSMPAYVTGTLGASWTFNRIAVWFA
ncbi:MAG: HupE/UreJ family protein [Myxococcota bacterium]